MKPDDSISSAATLPIADPIADLAETLATLTSSGRADAAEPARDVAPVGATRFELRDEIGSGSMGRVYSAIDRQFEREVAVKKLRGDFRGEEAAQRFWTECLVTANLEHPGVPAVYERGGDAEHEMFYAMRRVQGSTLEVALADAGSLAGRLELLPALIRVAQTLAYAHSRGVVHRDVKPSNVIIGTYGEVFLLDWGIAKVRGIATPTSPRAFVTADDTGSTQAGDVIGTPAYMAPEQAAGQTDAIDERTDVFALGAILYHILTGQPPYTAGTLREAIAHAAGGQFPALDRAAPRAPRSLRAICARAMAKSASDRYQSASEFAAALEAFTASAVAHRDRGLATQIGKVLLAVVLMVLVAGIGFGVLLETVPFAVQAAPTYVSLALTAIGLGLAGLEWSTRGRHRLGPLILALAVSTFINGVIGTATGTHSALRTVMATQPELAPATLMQGVREAISYLATSGILAIVQLLAWALARRRAMLA